MWRLNRRRRGLDRAGKRASTIEVLEPRLFLSASKPAAPLPGTDVRPGTSTITGVIWDDWNNVGRWDRSSIRVSNWTVYLDLNNDGVLEPAEPTSITSEYGVYTFTGLAPGTYTVRYVMEPSYRLAAKQLDHATMVIPAQTTRPVVLRADFGVTNSSGVITGTVMEMIGSTQQPAAHWGVFLDYNHNGRFDPGERWVATDDEGHFSIDSLHPGYYQVCVDPSDSNWNISSPTLGYAGVFNNGFDVSQAPTFVYRQNPPPQRFQVNQLVDYLLMGGSSADASSREVKPSLLGWGWPKFVSDLVQPDLDWGVRRIELHNPFGILPTDSVYPVDQYLQAQASGPWWLTYNFVQAWRPITQSGVEVIAYIGSPDVDPTFNALAAAGNTAGWNARFNACIAPLLQAGMSVGFDVGQTMVEGDLFFQAIQNLRANGVTVYLEGRAPESSTWRWSVPVITTDPSWINGNPYNDPTAGWAVKNSELPAQNIIRLVQQIPTGDNPQNRHWALSELHSIMAAGNVAGISVSFLRSLGLSLDQVLDPTSS